MLLINTELQTHRTCNTCNIVTAKQGGGTRLRSSLKHCATRRFRFPMVSLEFFTNLSLPAALLHSSQSSL